MKYFLKSTCTGTHLCRCVQWSAGGSEYWRHGCGYDYGYVNLSHYIVMQPEMRIPGLEEPKNSSNFLHLITGKVRI